MKLKEIKKFIDDSGNSIEFFPTKELRGFSHRVILNGKSTRKWLSSEGKPNKKSAEYFMNEFLSNEIYRDYFKGLMK